MAPALHAAVLAAALALSAAIQETNGVVDEEHQAIVVEAYHEPERRQGRQFSWFSGSTGSSASTSPFQGMLSSPSMSMSMCRTPSGRLALCGSNYQWGTNPWRQPQYPQYPQYPGTQYPGTQYPGAQYPGAQYPGTQYPGAQYPGTQYPDAQYPGEQYPGQYPGGQYPGQYPETQPQPQPPQTQPVLAPAPAPAPAPTPAPPPVHTTPVELPAGAATGQCGVSRYFPIRYTADGVVSEEQERIDEAGSKIVNGWPADKGEWPWIAALLNNGRQFCGGSLISRKHILTAAHCVAHMSRYDVANLKVRLGEHAIKQSGETELFESKAARVVRHKEFSQQTLHKDVAIITLETEVPQLSNVRPVCLAPQGGERYVDQHATVVGWGSLKENGPQPDILQEVTVRIWDNKVCKDTYGPAAPGGIMEHMLCAGQKGKDSCSGDSGGPMQIGSGNVWMQIGVVSWGIGCGKSHYPGVYSRVSSLRDWIDKITKDY